jgi:hypothetical protein
MRFNLIYYFLFLASLPHYSNAQQPANYSDIPKTPVNYNLPPGKNGLSEVYFMMNARVKITRWEKSADVRVSFDYKQGTAETLDPAFRFMYAYNGKLYGDQHVGKEIFNGIRADRDFTLFEVHVSAKGQQRTLKVARGEYQFLKINDPNLDANDVSVHFLGVSNIAFEGTNPIENKIRSLLESEKKQISIPAKTASPTNNTNSNSTNTPSKNPPNTKSTNASNSDLTENSVSSTPSKNTKDSPRSSNKENTDRSNSTNTSDELVQNSNVDLSNVSTYFKDQAGNHYLKIDNKSFKKISKVEYDAGKVVQQQKIQENKKETDKRFADSVNQSLKSSSSKYWEDTEKSHARVERDMNLLSANYYAAKELNNVRNEMKENSKLKDKYESVQELENDFRSKMGSLSSAEDRLATSKNQQLQTSYDYHFRDADASGRALGEAVVGVGSMINSLSAEKEAEKARRELAASREAARIKMEKERKKTQINLRRTLLNNFPEGGLPLSSHRVKTPLVFLFAYAIDSNLITQEKPIIKISNVFPIAKAADGTWPFKSIIQSDLSNLFRTEGLTLFGYFTDEIKTNELHAAFNRMAEKSGLQVQNISYKGRPSKSSKTESTQSSNTDFFGNPIKSKSNQSIDNTNSNKSNVDFFGNPIKQ